MPFLTETKGKRQVSPVIFTLVRKILMNHESRTVYLNTAIEALLKAEAALNELALAMYSNQVKRQAHAIPEPVRFPQLPR